MAKRGNDEEKKDGMPSGENGGGETPKIGGRYADLATIASKLSSAYPTGAPIYENVIHSTPDTGAEIKRYAFNAPGVMALEWVPTLGVSRSANSPLNLAWSEIAQYIKSRVNRRPIWETPDLAIMCMAVDSLISLHQVGQRAYGLLHQYDPLNKYYPQTIIEAAGFDFDDLKNNQLQMLFKLNQRASELAKYRLPGTFKLFARHMDYNTKVFLDGETVKCQMYVPRQKYFWSYERVDTVQGLTAVTLPAKCTVDEYFEVYDRLLTALRYSTDVDQIMGDVISAYGDAAVGIMPITEANYTTPIGYSREFMITLSNAVMLNIDPTTLRIYDAGGGVIKAEPAHNWQIDIATLQDQNYVIGNVEYLNFHEDVPTTEDVIQAMLWHPWVSEVSLLRSQTPSGQDEIGATSYRVEHCGTEVLVGAVMYLASEQGGDFNVMPSEVTTDPGLTLPEAETVAMPVYQSWNLSCRNIGGQANQGLGEFVCAYPYYAQFKNAPAVRLVAPPINNVANGPFYNSTQVIQNTQNRVPIDGTNVYQLMQALLYDSFFG